MNINDEHQWAINNYMEAIYLMTVYQTQLHEETEVLVWERDRLWKVLSTTLLDIFGAPSEYWVVVADYTDGMMTQFQMDGYVLMYYRNS